MTLENFYEALGADYNTVIQRIGDEARLKKYLLLVVNDAQFELLQAAFEQKDYNAAFRAAHTIKGICLNFDLIPLTNASVDLVECLRAGNTEEAAPLYQKVVDALTHIKKAILQLQ